jgi:hypothetical protein
MPLQIRDLRWFWAMDLMDFKFDVISAALVLLAQQQRQSPPLALTRRLETASELFLYFFKNIYLPQFKHISRFPSLFDGDSFLMLLFAEAGQ